MAFMDWLFGKKKDELHASNKDSVFSEFASSPKEIEKLNVAAELQRRNTLRRREREKRRENLFSIVRTCINDNKIFDQGYKFKVLSIDSHGKQFMVLIDLSIASIQNKSPSGLLMLEERITRAAAADNISVQAVYWRYFAHSISGKRTTKPAPLGATPPSAPVPLSAPASLSATPAVATGTATATAAAGMAAQATTTGAQTTTAAQTTAPAATAKPAQKFEPTRPFTESEIPSGNAINQKLPPGAELLKEDEIRAFKNAIAAAKNKEAARKAATPPATTPTPAAAPELHTDVSDSGPATLIAPKRHASDELMMTGYEDTEQDFDTEDIANLSKTQYGEL